MRKAFTMIEIIFVILIIGILASVAIPKMVSLRDDAQAKACVYEVGQFITELSQKYVASKTFEVWKTLKLEDNITNINLNIDTSGNGIHNGNEIVHDNTIAYHCEGIKILDIAASLNVSTGKYVLNIVIVDTPTTPVALKAANTLEKEYGGLVKVFRM